MLPRNPLATVAHNPYGDAMKTRPERALSPNDTAAKRANIRAVRILRRIERGERVADIAAGLGVSHQRVYQLKAKALSLMGSA